MERDKKQTQTKRPLEVRIPKHLLDVESANALEEALVKGITNFDETKVSALVGKFSGEKLLDRGCVSKWTCSLEWLVSTRGFLLSLLFWSVFLPLAPEGRCFKLDTSSQSYP
ncbi:hypothetical protein [Thermococcus sp.]|uniref:hypothetical protein n=1 Tax=Thermococcus sp. TaxID=35749 RepID=UPI0026217D92|nr:hypothetical protein [Thermococcus sp.]